MSHDDARSRVDRARVELDRAERQLATRWQSWRERLARHRLLVLIGGGLLGGFALGTVSPRRWSRAGALLFGGSAWLVHSPIGPVLLGALCTGLLGPATTTPPPAGRDAPRHRRTSEP